MNNTYKEFSDKVKMFSILLESKEFSNQKCYDLTQIETKPTPESRTVMASRLANTDEVKAFRKYLNSKQLINPIGLVNNKDEDSLQSDEAIIEINSDNILELLQAEYSCCKFFLAADNLWDSESVLLADNFLPRQNIFHLGSDVL